MAQQSVFEIEENQQIDVSTPVTPLEVFTRYDGIESTTDNPVVGAVWENRMISMRHPMEEPGHLEYVRYLDRHGSDFYRRGMILVLGLAGHRVLNNDGLHIGHSLEHGYYYQLKNRDTTPEDVLDVLTEEMNNIIENDFNIEVVLMDRDDALELFHERDQKDKVRLIETWEMEELQVHQVDDFYDLAYFPAPGSTGVLQNFELRPYTPGFILRFPDPEDVHQIPEAEDQPKLFQIYQESKNWAKILDVDDVGSLNKVIIDEDVGEFIKISEAFHAKKISRIADEIKERIDHIDLITIAGPSSSGKTTFSKRLAIQLRVIGVDSVKISTDNYFVEREDTPLDEDGEYDFEHIEAIDLPLFNEHLEKLRKGEPIEVPEFSFEHGTRKEETNTLEIEDDQLVIVEGIHGLNPRFTEAIPRHRKYLIYVSALTQLVIDDHNRISTSDCRLIRRIVRDMLFRDITPETNIQRWPSVRRGEIRWIFPHQELADVMFNSALLYELAALKSYIVPALEQISQEKKAAQTAHRIRRFADLFKPIDSQEIPPTSILREFIGGSSFDY
ncbi:MAG: nucleoside kinase [bacterium]